MNGLAAYIVVAWVVAMLGVFPFLGIPRRAVLFIVISGTLFLPESIPDHVSLGPIHFSKYHAISYAALFGVLLFDLGRLFTIRPSLFDIPAIVWCLCPFPSVMTNNPPPDGSSMVYDAFAQTWAQIVSYGIPYLLGRMYFKDRQSFRDLGIGIISGALIYVPFCLYEIKMSPQLHAMVYGYFQHAFDQTIRSGGYRPMVFMTHGLTLALFMLSATVFACLMWRSRELSRGLRYSPIVLGVTFVLLKSTGALALGFVGGIAFLTAQITKSRLPLLLLAIVPIIYVPVRTNGVWAGDSLVQFVAANISEDRGKSLEFRLMNENALVQKAFQRFWFGWGGWARSFVHNEETGKDSVPDGLWIIALGERGVVGLLGLGGLALIPIIRFALLFSPSKSLQWAPVTAGVYVLALATIDSLPNVGLVSPIYFMIVGGLTRMNPVPKQSLVLAPPLLLGRT